MKTWQHIDNVVNVQYNKPVQYTHAKYTFKFPVGSDSSEYITCIPVEHKKIKPLLSNIIDNMTNIECNKVGSVCPL